MSDDLKRLVAAEKRKMARERQARRWKPVVVQVTIPRPLWDANKALILAELAKLGEVALPQSVCRELAAL